MKTPKILFIANTSWFIYNFELKLIQEYQHLGYEVVAVAPGDATSLQFSQNGVHFIELHMERRGLNPFYDIKLLKRLYSIYVSEKPDIVFLSTIKPVIYGSIAARFAGVKKILAMISGLGYVFIGDGLKSRILRAFVKKMYKYSLSGTHCVFFQNPDDRLYFLKNKLVLEEKTILTYGLGVDIDHFQYIESHSTTQVCTFLYIGRMLWDKGVGEFALAAQKIKQIYPKSRFQLLGKIDTDNPSHIERADIDKWLLIGAIEYLGETSDVRPLIEAADVIVLPSYREGIPNSLLEGMAMGRSIITTDVPGCRETVIDKVNGLLIPPRNVDALAQAMEFMILNPGKRVLMGKESRKLVTTKFDVKSVNAIIIKSMNFV